MVTNYKVVNFKEYLKCVQTMKNPNEYALEKGYIVTV